MEFDEDFLKSVINESFVSPKVERRDSPGKGVGLFATETIFKDEIVSISGGVVIRSEDWKKYKNEFGDYAYNIEEDFMIMPLNPKDPSDDWRMNHCCDANCGLRGQIVFVAMKNIEPGEELLFDYAMTESDPDYRIPLSCGREGCRGEFCGNDWLNPEIQKKYAGYFSSYIERKIKNLNNKAAD